MVKNPPAKAGDAKEEGSIPGLDTSLEEGMVAHCSILAWKIPRAEEPGELLSIGLQRLRHD